MIEKDCSRGGRKESKESVECCTTGWLVFVKGRQQLLKTNFDKERRLISPSAYRHCIGNFLGAGPTPNVRSPQPRAFKKRSW